MCVYAYLYCNENIHFRFFSLQFVKEKNIMKSCANTYLRSGKTEEGKIFRILVFFAEFLYNPGQ